MRDPAFPLPPAEGVPNGEVGAMDLEQLQKEKQGLEQQLLERNKVRSSPQPFCPRLKALRAFRGFAGAPGTSWGCAQEKGFVLAFLSAPACVPTVLHTPVVSGPACYTVRSSGCSWSPCSQPPAVASWVLQDPRSRLSCGLPFRSCEVIAVIPASKWFCGERLGLLGNEMHVYVGCPVRCLGFGRGFIHRRSHPPRQSSLCT